jgi:hypothetical protein
MKKYLFTVTSLFAFQFTFGQHLNLVIKEIDSIVNRIESSCISGGITEYIIKSKNKKTKKIINGSGADWYYTDSSSTNLLKVVKETSLDSDNFDTYYFYRDTLIYLKTTNLTYYADKKIINWKRECYFQGEKILLTQDNLKISFNPKNYIETAKEFFIGNQIWKK